MAKLTPAQLAAFAAAAGFANGAGYQGRGLTWAVAIALAESDGRTDARHTNGDGSVDRGPWQINSRWHPEAAATNPATAAAAAYRISNSGTNFRAWATFTNGAAGAQLGRAAMAAARPASAADVEAAGWHIIPGPLLPIPLPDHVPNPVDAAKDLAAGVAGLLTIATRGAGWVSNPHNTVRIVEVLAGLGAAALALALLNRDAIGAVAGKAAVAAA